tara:strand:- start:42934 stop:43797 length:864 start_codon:yes stop_codon:yes gene_type:complete
MHDTAASQRTNNVNEESGELIDQPIAYFNDAYETADPPVTWFSRTFPTFNFYRKFGWNVYRSSANARHGKYDDAEWSRSSHQVLQAIESVGVRIQISGIDHIQDLSGPCVFVGNHMSMFETIILPCIIRPFRPVTFVVKQGLMDYPVFRHIVRARDPIAVSRDDPRADFKAVIQGGTDRLGKGISIVVFPQTTRSDQFDPAQFNTIGVKLAAKAGVPVVPVALVTDAWGNGKWIKDLGPIDPTKTVRIAFGHPIEVQGRGAEQHQQVIDFIEGKLSDWTSERAEERT